MFSVDICSEEGLLDQTVVLFFYFVLMWVSPEADARTSITGQRVYLGDNFWTLFGGDELACKTRKGKRPVRGVSPSRAVIWVT